MKGSFFILMFIFISSVASAQEGNRMNLVASKLMAYHPDPKKCNQLLGEVVKSEVFDKYAAKGATFTLSKDFKGRMGLDGAKIWFKMTGKNEKGEERIYDLNLRVQHGKDPNHDPREFCKVNQNTGYPLYVTDPDGFVVAQVVGKSILTRTGSALFELVFPGLDLEGGGFFK